MDMNSTKMENKYWTNHLIIREMRIRERYKSDRLKVTGEMKTQSNYDSVSQRMREFDVGNNVTSALPSLNRYTHGKCHLLKKEFFWKEQSNYDGDDDDDNDDSMGSDHFEVDNQFHLPRLQATLSKIDANYFTDDFHNIAPIHKSKFMISNNGGKYYNHGNNEFSTQLKQNVSNNSNEYIFSSEMHNRYKNRNCFDKQFALSSDEDDELQKHGGDDSKQLFSKTSINDDLNYTYIKNRRRAKVRKHKPIWTTNKGKTNEKFGDECDTDSDHDGHHNANNPVWAESYGKDNTKSGEKELTIDNELAVASGTKKPNHKSSLTTSKNNIRKHQQVSPKKEIEEKPLAKKIVDNKGVYQNTQKQILRWMTHNYGRMIDVFKKFDVDNSGSLSMEEFYQGMKDLGAPGTQVDLYMMAKALDRDGDETIDYHEFRRIRGLYKKSAGKRTRGRHAHFIEDTQSSKLQPCSKCCIGITEPTTQNKHQRHISVRMSSISHDPIRKYSIEPFVFDVSPDTTVYGIQRLTRAELGGSATNVRIFRRRDNRNIELLEMNRNLGDYGYEGNITSDNPEIVMLFYDYTYPGLDCPLVSASLSR